MESKINVALVQFGPEYLQLSRSLEKASDLIDEASNSGADLIVFGETWLSGYPIWIDYCPEAALWDYEPVKEVWARTFENGIEIHGNEIKSLQSLAKDKNISIVIGANEVIRSGKGNGTIYNTIITINSNGNIVNHHRKLMPTFSEKLIYGLGDGAGLKSVELNGFNIGSLICWEHWMPLARQAMHDASEDIHIGLWPMVKEMNRVATQHYAFEGRCYAIAVGQTMQAKDLPSILNNPFSDNPEKYILSGNSCVFGPDGSLLFEGKPNEETIYYIEIENKTSLFKERMNLAVSGHYQRNDVFQLNIDHKRLF